MDYMPDDSQLSVALVETNSHPLGVQLVSARKTNKLSEAADLVELAKSIQKADEFTKANVGSKLTVIAEQIQHLQRQARKILEEAKRDAALHHAACNLVKKSGTVYFLYRRESGQSYLSLLSPQEWGSSCPHEFLGGFRLEYDQSWTPVTDLAKRDRDNAFIDNLYKTQQALTAGPITDDMLLLGGCGMASQVVDITENVGLLQES